MGTVPANQPPLKIAPMFAVPCGTATMQGCSALNGELRALFLAREGDVHANPRPLTQRNNMVFESHFDVFRWQEPCIQQLKEFCWAHLMTFVAALNGYDEATRRGILIYSDAWFHVTRRGGFFGLHNHPNATWSGVYCVDAGRRDADKPSSGQLSFVNPFLSSAMYLDISTAKLQPLRLRHSRPTARAWAARAVSFVAPARREAVRRRGRAHHRRLQLLVRAARGVLPRMIWGDEGRRETSLRADARSRERVLPV